MSEQYDYATLADRLIGVGDGADPALSDDELAAIDHAAAALRQVADDSSAVADNADDQGCPICGQQYANKLKRRPTSQRPDVRGDARVCKTSVLASRRTLYIHLPSGEGESA
jgi:hypothetical protein